MEIVSIRNFLKSLGCICIIFLLMCTVEIWPLLGGRIETQLVGVVYDEYSFMNEIIRIRNMLLNGEFYETLQFGTPFGYGYIYWLLMGVFAIPYSFLNYPDSVLLFRLIGLFFKAITLFYLFKAISLTAGKLQGSIAVLLVLCMPGFWFYGKIISPEFIILGIISISMYLLVKDNLEIGKNYYFSITVFALAVSIKMTVLPLGIVYPLCLIIKKEKNIIYHFIITPIIMTFLFLIFNCTLITKNGWLDFTSWLNYNSKNSHYPTWSNLESFYSFSNHTWDRIPNAGLMIDYLNIYLIIGFFIIFLWGIYRGNRHVMLIPFGISSLLFIIITMSTQILHSWYLLVPLLMFVFSICLSSSKDKLIQYALIFMILITASVNFTRIIEKYNSRMLINNEVQENYEKSFVIKDYLERNYTSGTILTNPFLALPALDIEDVKIVRNADIIVYLENGDYSIIERYPETKWLYVRNELKFLEFELVKQSNDYRLYRKKD